jgi:hypothetical protein
MMADYSPKDLARALMMQQATAQDGGNQPRGLPPISLDRPSVLAPIPPKAAPPIEYDPAHIDRCTGGGHELAPSG